MDKRILDIVSSRFLLKKEAHSLELEKLINNTYNLSVEETTDRIVNAITGLNESIHQLQMWEEVLNQVTPQKPEGENNK